MPKKLRAERDQKSYKRIDAYLKRVYKENKDYINNNIDDFILDKMKTTAEDVFYRTVKEIWKNKEFDETLGRKIKTYNEAIDKAQRSSLISTRTHYQELVYDEIVQAKEDGPYKDIRSILKTRKFNPDNINYIGEQSTAAGWETWYEYSYQSYEKYQKVAQRGKNKGHIIWARRKIEKSFYIVYHKSVKTGGGGWYEVIDVPTPEMMKNLK